MVVADDTAKRQLERLGGVVAVYPVQQIQLPQTQAIQASAEPQMFTARGMTGADIANNEFGLTGKGIKVGVIDTGIDTDHPAFKGRIIKQHDFVGDAYNANDPAKSTPVPDENADDCGGHGTHVSGIVGGNDPSTGFKGVAPDVVFGAYKVFGCEGSVNDPVIMDAMEMAVRDGMQVINMSLGSGYDWAESPLARAASRVVKRGVVMVNSQGNEGDNGQFSSGSPAAGDQVISVGSVANVAFRLPKAVLSDGTEIGYTNDNDGHDAPLSGSIEVVKGPKSSPTATADGCTSSGGYAPGSLTGKLVLIRRGTCTFYEKAFNAQKAGAAVVLIYNRLPEHLDGVGLTGDPAITVPVISISGVLGAKIDAAISKGKTTLSWTKDTISIANPAGNTNSTFSSIGATPSLTFKPEVSAPGGSIYSTYPLSKTAVGYQTLSGTSMSSPHVAGAVALLLQARPGLAAKDVVTLLQNTARPVSLRYGTTTYNGLLNYVQQQGAGMINIPAAATTQVTATPSKLELGESQTFPTRLKVVVLKNSSSKAVTYTAYHYPALTLTGTTYSVVPDDENAATMTVNGQSVEGDSTVDVTVPAGGQAELNLAITAPAGADDLSQYGGYLMLDSKNGGGHLSVPYMGFKGDYQAIPVLTDAYIGNTKVKFPLLIQRDADGDQDFAPDKPVYTLADIKPGKPDRPYAFVHFNHQARKANLDVLNANGSLGRRTGPRPVPAAQCQGPLRRCGRRRVVYLQLGRQERRRQDPAAQRRPQTAPAGAQATGRREQPRRLGRVGFAGLYPQAHLSQAFSGGFLAALPFGGALFRAPRPAVLAPCFCDPDAPFVILLSNAPPTSSPAAAAERLLGPDQRRADVLVCGRRRARRPDQLRPLAPGGRPLRALVADLRRLHRARLPGIRRAQPGARRGVADLPPRPQPGRPGDPRGRPRPAVFGAALAAGRSGGRGGGHRLECPTGNAGRQRQPPAPLRAALYQRKIGAGSRTGLYRRLRGHAGGQMTDLEQARQCLQAAQRVAVMTGAGVSAESGIPTFRAAQTGHWARFKPEDLASPQAYRRDPETVWAWYAGRCRDVTAARPNPGHLALAELERRKEKAETAEAETGNFLLATQNVDGLHQRAGSRRLAELHGNLTRARCESCGLRQPLMAQEPFTPPHCPACGVKMRPDVVWFGENLPRWRWPRPKPPFHRRKSRW